MLSCLNPIAIYEDGVVVGVVSVPVVVKLPPEPELILKPVPCCIAENPDILPVKENDFVD